ncbi:PEGA domain-containing protein [Corallococcus sp. AB049A]|uniref:PEGA domain-containing protein n=1 Tax=Corallococcus interemptor TaxID=2316720 RepID=A0A3A8Q7F5_9BACT|nr:MULTISPECIES: PEGA domain-containing protein [Corallococcus]RKH51182.1 PEGA domain-containing protein [Corallococcus sp. AB050B]RKH64586.1 PEGA domain-containing protein [Corallococcus interemptor]RKI72304.1 PEGA domain-containing protein [Corallococcus sp. AB049A]
MKALPLALVLLPALALSAPPASGRISALLIPMDPSSESSGVQMESYMNDALGNFANYAVRKPRDLFGLPDDPAAQASFARAKKGYEESVKAFEAREYEDAERKVRATLKELEGSVASMTSCFPLCDALALHGAILQLRGDVEEAKLLLIDLMALNPTFELNPKRFSRDFISLRVQVATSRTSQLRGSATFKSRPAGARVYVDGEAVGYTPLTLPTLPVGKHLVRMERPGFRQYGQITEVTPDDVDVTAVLAPTATYKAYDAQLDKVIPDVSRPSDKPANAIVALLKSLSLDRAMVGTVRVIPERGTELSVGYFDVKNGKRMGSRKLVLQGDEYGQLKLEMERVVNHILNSEGEQVVKKRDPLDNRSGAEDWGSEDRGGNSRQSVKKHSGEDPLDDVSGTEDW